jgi:prepilin peptidase CpaA
VEIAVSTALWFAPFAVPIGIWVAWNDMAFMKIPNKAVLALFAAFVVIGLVALPFDTYLWRYAQFAGVLALGFLLNIVRALGAGDAKFAAAMAPFVDPGDARVVLVLFAAVLLAAFVTHRAARALPAMRAAFPTWESWTRSDFPMGLALGGTLIFYLLLGIVFGTSAG